MNVNSDSPLSEAYRALRMNIQFSSSEYPVKTLVAASATSGDGRSTTVANLAIVYAQEGKKTLLIDGDLRNPSLHEMFKISKGPGLTNVLLDDRNWTSVVQESSIPRLSVLTSGITSLNPSDILASDRMQAMVQELKQHYDVILFDSPPLLNWTDGMVISSFCDGVFIIISQGKTKGPAVKKIQQNLEHAKVRVLGAVINKIKYRKTI